MNNCNEDGWEEVDDCEDARNFNEVVDVITGFLIGLIVTAIAYLVL